MAKEIYVKGNYLFIDDSPKPIKRFPLISCYYKKNTTTWNIIDKDTGINFPILIADVADWYNEAGDVAYNEGTMDTLLEDNTGKPSPEANGATDEFNLRDNSIGGTVQTATGDGTTTIDWKRGNMFDFQFGAFNEVFTFTPPTNPGTFILKLVQDSGGSRTVTWPGTVKWPGGVAPTLTTTLTTGTDIITFYWNGTTYSAVSTLDLS